MIAVIHYTVIAKGIVFAVILLTFKGAYAQICLLLIFTVLYYDISIGYTEYEFQILSY
jgi:hypothetical protein